MYVDSYRNTFAVDVLEYLGLVKLNQRIPSKNDDSEESDLEGEQQFKIDVDSLEKQNFREPSDMGDINGAVERMHDVEDKSDPFLIEFSGPDDPEHPHNWPLLKKTVVIIEVSILTFITYMGSSIYTPGQEQVEKEFGIGHVVATLNLSVYVMGYGIGPVIFSPLSEFAIFGRQQLYIVTLFLFTMLQVGCALVQNIAGLVILRFLTGVLCSPSLATGAASIGDVAKPALVPILLGLWTTAAYAAPCLGPLLGAAMVVAKDWRWIFWLLMWMSALILIILVFFFPETSEDNILHRRCERIKKITGDNRYYTFKAREESKLKISDIAIIALYRPFEIMVKEPMVLVLDIYIALTYGIFYLFFESFPIVFSGVYHFTLVEQGLPYLGFLVGCVFAYAASFIFLRYYADRKTADGTFTPESFLVLAMCVSWCLPAGLFMFGWTASVHWMVPIVSELLFVMCDFNLWESIFSYLAVSYPKYVASVFAGNGILRAGFASGFPLFGRAMYDNLAIKGFPVGWGSSLLGFITAGMALLPFIFYKYGPYLRSKSRFTG